ncbi:hypothetical protein E4U43_006323 [Claviceps pusilla]|uniref:Uncharacterized protein n=1 Tax=Claviceps pusilla TaxID=123648 RepID=A0A9P7NDU1_9HYPO|nr:hypothetical protein E4U43_006323 [Claviceps pusilla]
MANQGPQTAVTTNKGLYSAVSNGFLVEIDKYRYKPFNDPREAFPSGCSCPLQQSDPQI